MGLREDQYECEEKEKKTIYDLVGQRVFIVARPFLYRGKIKRIIDGVVTLESCQVFDAYRTSLIVSFPGGQHRCLFIHLAQVSSYGIDYEQ